MNRKLITELNQFDVFIFGNNIYKVLYKTEKGIIAEHIVDSKIEYIPINDLFLVDVFEPFKEIEDYTDFIEMLN